jgi:23S rRNA pseudouridine2605 synthase
VQYGSIEASMDGAPEGRNAWLVFKLAEGKNREVRRVCEQLGLQVNRLIRTDYGAFSLEGLPRGAFEEVGPGELRKTLGALAGPPNKKGKPA